MTDKDRKDFDRASKISRELVGTINGNSTDVAIKEWLNNSQTAPRTIAEFADSSILEQRLEKINSLDREQLRSKFFDAIDRVDIEKKKSRKSLYISLLSLAAAVIAISLLVWRGVADNDTVNIEKINTEQLAVAPYSDVVVSIGTQDKLMMNQDKDTILSGNTVLYNKESGDITIRNSEAKLVSDLAIKEEIQPKELIHVSVKGGKIQHLNLEDGTRITINSGSTLTYNPNTNVVDVAGEAFFDVSKQEGKPMLVNTGDYTVKVYGTRFNVNNFNNEKIEIFLQQGSIGISDSLDYSVKLKPSDLFSLDAKAEPTVKYVDDATIVAWKDGYFAFNKTSIEEVAAELSRWYNIEIVCDGENFENTTISGQFGNDIKWFDLINAIKIVTGVEFKIKPME